MQDAGACIGRVGAGHRFSRRGAQRHLGAFGGIKVVFTCNSVQGRAAPRPRPAAAADRRSVSSLAWDAATRRGARTRQLRC
eukprot:7333426-Prymnesium_polylepis.1